MKQPDAAETGFADSKPKFHPFEAIVVSALFVVMICLPLIKQLTIGEANTASMEKRIMAPPPNYAMGWTSRIKLLPQQIDAYYKDHFGMRYLLLEMGSFLDVKLFGFSMSAVIGKEGFIYYRVDPPLFCQSLTAEDLAKWKKYLERRQQWLAARGIKYLFVVPSDKDSIYPEFLPFTSRPPPAELPVDQLIRYLKETHSTVDVLSLKEPLLAAKTQERDFLYFRQDGHWNTLGAYYGYAAIMQRLAKDFPALKTKPRSDYRLDYLNKPYGDAGRQAGVLNFKPLLEPLLLPVVPDAAQKEILNLSDFSFRPFTTQLPDHANLPTAVMMRDSFAIALAPYLSESFSRITYFWFAHLEKNERTVVDFLAREKPDIFIEERIQRFICVIPDEKTVFGGVDQTGTGAQNP